MHLKCLFGHQWHGCICWKCKNTRDLEHDWGKNCEKCARCGVERTGAHDWGKNCEKCARCGAERTGAHDWGKDCEKCARCGVKRTGAHDWGKDCEKCVRCGGRMTPFASLYRRAFEEFGANLWNYTAVPAPAPSDALEISYSLMSGTADAKHLAEQIQQACCAVLFTDNGDGTVTCNKTGLMWQKDDSGQLMNWGAAWDYADLLTLAGYEDWRLPSAQELVSLCDHVRITEMVFPSMKNDFYWSSSPYAGSPNGAKYVKYKRVYDDAQKDRGHYYVRCVRLGPSR